MKIIKFNFCSRKWISKRNYDDKGVKIFGTAYFLINENGIIIGQIPQLIKSQYRRTDREMVKAVGYWKKKDVQKFRRKFLSEDENNLGDKKQPRPFLEKSQLEQINKEFRKNKTSFKTYLSYLAGSNVTGCEQKKLAQPYFYVSNIGDDEWNMYNFLNCFKPITKRDKNVTLNFDQNHEYITLKQYFELFPKVKHKGITYSPEDLFEEWNKMISMKKFQEKKPIDLKSIQFVSSQQNKVIKKYESDLENYLTKTQERIDLYLNKLVEYDDKQLKNFVSTRYTNACEIAIQERILSYNSIESDSTSSNFENCHIVSKSWLLKQKSRQSLIDATSPFNCLRLSPNLHTAFDKGQMTFTPDGKIISNTLANKNQIEACKDITQFEERKKFVEKNWQYWTKNGKNL